MGPAATGTGPTVVGSAVGPYTSIAEERHTVDSEIGYPIALRGARIDGVGRIEASLIGRESVGTPAPAASAVRRLLLGDHGEVRTRA